MLSRFHITLHRYYKANNAFYFVLWKYDILLFTSYNKQNNTKAHFFNRSLIQFKTCVGHVIWKKHFRIFYLLKKIRYSFNRSLQLAWGQITFVNLIFQYFEAIEHFHSQVEIWSSDYVHIGRWTYREASATHSILTVIPYVLFGSPITLVPVIISTRATYWRVTSLPLLSVTMRWWRHNVVTWLTHNQCAEIDSIVRQLCGTKKCPEFVWATFRPERYYVS